MSWTPCTARRALRAAALLAMLAAAHAQPPVERLHDTGWQPAAAGALSFAPQYPLWTDGADKRRWIVLPPGTFVDASRAGAWEFPPGTRLWKEFAFAGRPVETRLIERRPDGSWHFATYVWNADGSDARLAPERGIAALPVAAAPGGRYSIPGRGDCLACHDGDTPVLGFSALQLSAERDPLAPPARAGELNLDALLALGAVRNLPQAMRAPRIDARNATERAALGYLHANCGHCHNDGPARVPVGLSLAQPQPDALRTMLLALSRYRPAGAAGTAYIVVPGRPDDSVLALRMRSRQPKAQMPPLGTLAPDAEGLALVERWIRQLPQPIQENAP